MYQGHELDHKSQVIPSTRRNTGISAGCCVFGLHRDGCNAWECLQRVRSLEELFTVLMGRGGDQQWAGPWLSQAGEEVLPSSNAMRSAPNIPAGNTAGTGPPAGNNNLILDSPQEGWTFLFLTHGVVPESRREFWQGGTGGGKTWKVSLPWKGLELEEI